MYSLYANNTIEWSGFTFAFYFILVFLSYLLPKIRTTIVIPLGRNKYKTQIGLLLTEIMLIFVKGFSVCGTDLVGGYYFDFLSANSFSSFRDQTVEKGYIFLNIIIKNIYDYYWFFVLITSIISIVPVFRFIRKHSDSLDPSIALILYTSIYFFPTFSLLRIGLAAAIGVLSFDALIEGRNKKAIFWLFVACTIHTTAILLVAVVIVYNLKKINKKTIALFGGAFFVILYFNKSSLSSLLVNRYSIYSLASSSDGIGMEQLIYLTPILVLFLLTRRLFTDEEDHIVRLNFCYIVLSFLAGMMMYLLPAMGRTYLLFTPLIFLISNCSQRVYGINKEKHRYVNICIVIYAIFRFYMYITQYYGADGIMPYFNLFGWRM